MTTKDQNSRDETESTVDSRRSALTKLAASGALSAAPKTWVAPAVMAVALPAHAECSPSDPDCEEPPIPCDCVSGISVSVAKNASGSGPVGGPYIGSLTVTVTSSAPATSPLTITGISITNGNGELASVPALPTQIYSGKPIVFGWVGGMVAEGKDEPLNNVPLKIDWLCCNGTNEQKSGSNTSFDLKNLAPQASPVSSPEPEARPEPNQTDARPEPESEPEAPPPEPEAPNQPGERPEPEPPETPIVQIAK